MLDLSQNRDAHIDQRLRDDLILWFGTVRPDGRPHLVPVWFLWDDGYILIFSQPNNRKVRNLRENQHVVLALDNTKGGGDVVTIEGEAELLPPDAALSMAAPKFTAKYGVEIEAMNTTVEAISQAYSQGIRVTPRRFLGFGE